MHVACVGQAMHEFVAKCLDKDAMARSGAGELLKHPFLRRARDERFLAQHLLGLGTLKPSRSAFHIRSGGGGSSPDSTQVRRATYPNGCACFAFYLVYVANKNSGS